MGWYAVKYSTGFADQPIVRNQFPRQGGSRCINECVPRRSHSPPARRPRSPRLRLFHGGPGARERGGGGGRALCVRPAMAATAARVGPPCLAALATTAAPAPNRD